MGLEVYEYTGAGYNATMHFEDWRVANINFGENFDKPTKMSRHMLTDEVCKLLSSDEEERLVASRAFRAALAALENREIDV